MSIRIPRTTLSEEDIAQFEKTLVIVDSKPNLLRNCPWIIPTRISLVEHDEEYVYLPFYWGIQYFGKETRPLRSECQSMMLPFQGRLREEQTVLFQETIELLNRQNSALLAMYPGAGKCFAKGTRILLWNGLWKTVEQVVKGDLLVGDDGCPREVLALGSGRETLYRIYDSRFPSHIYYDVNESHILTVFDSLFQTCIDLPLHQWLQMTVHEKSRYQGIYRDHEGPAFPLMQKRAYYLTQKGTLSNLSDAQLAEAIRDLMLSGYWIQTIHPQNSNQWNLSFSDPWDVSTYLDKRVMLVYPIHVKKLSPNKPYYGFQVDQNGRFLLWNGIITHNTILSLAISANIGMRTLILVNKLVLIYQWEEALRMAFGIHMRYQVLQSRSRFQEDCHFYIMNAINVSKRNRSEFHRLKIGLVIVDECHLIMTRTLSKSLSYASPRYLIGLSATPFRPDGFDRLLDLNFGVRKIVRKLHRTHKVFWIETPIKIQANYTSNGKIMWNSVIDQQCHHKDRNQFIVSLCLTFSDRHILILSKRCSQIEWLHKELEKEHQSVDSMTSSQTSFNKDARILIATYQKVGTGFSHEKLDMLILATDTEEYFIQYLGRVFRTPFVEPIIVDMVDKHPILRRHFLTRRKIYTEVGGTILSYPYTIQNLG